MFASPGANRRDSVVFEQLINALPKARGKPGRPRRWPKKLHADKGYEFPSRRAHLKRRRIQDRTARRGSRATTDYGAIDG